MHVRTRVRSVVALAMALMMVFAGVAMADNVRNDVVLTGGGIRTLTPGTTTVVTYNLQSQPASQEGPGGLQGCNAETGPVNVTVNTPAGVTADPPSFSFAGCGGGNTESVTFSSSAAGDHAITHSISGPGVNNNEADFTLRVTAPPKSDQTITFDQPSTPRQYGDSFTVAPTASSGLAVTVSADGSCEINGNDVTMTSGSGTCTLTASQAGDDAYNAAADVERTVEARTRAASVTPAAASKTYGDADPVLTGTLSGFLAADGVIASYSRTAGEDAGSYTISASLSPSGVLSNYDVTSNTAVFTIDQRPITVTADAKSKVFGAADPDLTYQVTGSLLGGDAFSGSLARDPGEEVGTYRIRQGTLSAGPNYAIDYVPADLTIAAWQVEGFYAPIGRANSVVQAPGTPAPSATAGTVWNTGKGGSTLPLKFKVFNGQGGAERTDTASVKSFTATTLTCPSNGSADAMEDAELLPSNIGTSLKYDGEQFHQNWKTSKVSKDTCYRVGVTLQDGTGLYTFVRLLK